MWPLTNRYNAAVRTDIPFNPNAKESPRTEGLEVNQSNWADMFDAPPFEAYAMTCGITFTFGRPSHQYRRAGDESRHLLAIVAFTAGGTTDFLREFVQREYEKWRTVVRDSEATVE